MIRLLGYFWILDFGLWGVNSKNNPAGVYAAKGPIAELDQALQIHVGVKTGRPGLRGAGFGLLCSFLPNHSDEFVVVTPLVGDVAASRLLDGTAKSLRKFFRGRLYLPVALLFLQAHDPLERIFFPRALLLVPQDPDDLPALSCFNTQQPQFTAWETVTDLSARRAVDRMGMDWIAKSTRRVQCPVTPIIESSTTAALDDSCGGFP